MATIIVVVHHLPCLDELAAVDAEVNEAGPR
jgi:hypothetical protein